MRSVFGISSTCIDSAVIVAVAAMSATVERRIWSDDNACEKSISTDFGYSWLHKAENLCKSSTVPGNGLVHLTGQCSPSLAVEISVVPV